MNSLSFPDVNVWLALMRADHVHRQSAKTWWEADCSDKILFSRVTQISVLRLLTTSAAMNGKPLSMRQAWHAFDRLFEDDRVKLLSEPEHFDIEFRKRTSTKLASPKAWADAYIVAFATKHNAMLITFDRALQNSGADCLLLA
jgi:toxin-antitoxin system PIN domain toxin